jgi:hypothetical protein
MFHATGLTGSQRAAIDMPTAAPAAEAKVEVEKQFPQDEVETLRSQLDEVKKRLAELEDAKTQE